MDDAPDDGSRRGDSCAPAIAECDVGCLVCALPSRSRAGSPCFLRSADLSDLINYRCQRPINVAGWPRYSSLPALADVPEQKPAMLQPDVRITNAWDLHQITLRQQPLHSSEAEIRTGVARQRMQLGGIRPRNPRSLLLVVKVIAGSGAKQAKCYDAEPHAKASQLLSRFSTSRPILETHHSAIRQLPRFQ